MTETQRLLLDYAREGSERAFRELVERYLNLVYSTALRLVEGDAHRAQDITQMTFWWPSHRPMEVFSANGQVPWAQGIPQTHAGDLKMVTVWKDLGFIMNEGTDDNPNFVQVERNDQNL